METVKLQEAFEKCETTVQCETTTLNLRRFFLSERNSANQKAQENYITKRNSAIKSYNAEIEKFILKKKEQNDRLLNAQRNYAFSKEKSQHEQVLCEKELIDAQNYYRNEIMFIDEQMRKLKFAHRNELYDMGQDLQRMKDLNKNIYEVNLADIMNLRNNRMEYLKMRQKVAQNQSIEALKENKDNE